MCGSFSMRRRSLKVPGSDSSALQIRYFGLGVSFGMNDHFVPVGKPAPPRPRSADFLTSSVTSPGLIDATVLRRALYPPPASYTPIVCESRLSTLRSRTGSKLIYSLLTTPFPRRRTGGVGLQRPASFHRL